MKRMMTAIAAVAFLGTNAMAATPTKKAATATKKSAAPAVVAVPEEATAVAPIEVQTVPAVSVGGGQSAVATPTAPEATTAKKASARIIDRVSVPMGQTNGQRNAETNDLEASGELSIRLGYKLSDKLSVGLGTDADHSFGELSTGKAKWVPYDVFASVAHSELLALPANVKVKGSARLYAPTSEGSQAIGQIARLRPNVTISKEFGPVNLSYSADPQLYFQRNNVVSKTSDKGEEISGTRNFRLLHYVAAEVTITPKWSAYSNLGLDEGWYNNDSSKQLAKNFKPTSALYAETGVGYTVNDNLSLVAGVDQYDPDLLAQEPGKEGPLYRDEFTRYFLEGTVSF